MLCEFLELKFQHILFLIIFLKDFFTVFIEFVTILLLLYVLDFLSMRYI